MRYTTLLFDADGTLFDYRRSSFEALRGTMEYLNAPFSPEINDLYQEINQSLWAELEQGKVTREELRTLRFERFFKTQNIPVERKEEADRVYVELLGRGTHLLPGVEEFIRSLVGKFKMYIITNGIAEVQKPRFRDSAIFDCFDGVFISSEIGIQKPMKGYFDYVLNHISEDNTEKILVIGDSLTSDIQGGNNAGLDTCWFNPMRKANDSTAKPTYEIKNLTDLYEIF